MNVIIAGLIATIAASASAFAEGIDFSRLKVGSFVISPYGSMGCRSSANIFLAYDKAMASQPLPAGCAFFSTGTRMILEASRGRNAIVTIEGDLYWINTTGWYRPAE